MLLLAIDPGTHKTGCALFDHGTLIKCATFNTTYTERRKRQQDIVLHIAEEFDEEFEHVAIEDPFLQGTGNKMMQRLIGALEVILPAPFTYFAPTSVKKSMGSGKLDKLEVALAAGQMLKTEKEQDLMASMIEQEAWDATDAVAIGLTFILGGKQNA